MDIFVNYGLIIIGLIISGSANFFVKMQYASKSKIINNKGVTGAQIARNILDKNGLQDVKVNSVNGQLTDHYDPRTKVVNLSESVYSDTSIASIAVAAHEVGHAIQDKENDLFMRIRSSLVPITNFSSYAGYLVIFIGAISGLVDLIGVGILLMVVVLLFQLITLPVEFGASKRALKELDESFSVSESEIGKCKTMLTAAALTYVASVITVLLEILRLLMIFRRRD